MAQTQLFNQDIDPETLKKRKTLDNFKLFYEEIPLKVKNAPVNKLKRKSRKR